ncbi:hypothetical protein GCM10010277_77810 [Streptomyces longisporoflavus]|uniref:hypothetical protein n=1 Tax=Streptomyces longisporoflavus TaxID=28044 RepID=UPI00167EE569|nr:hypothetical protein [Streptomyces longisporoflavus]GGV68461.1 hypothetical protein GCM10010277_77810 [Streptomyces longisporoflavus]
MDTLGVTIGLAFIGYIATYLNGLRLTQRQARLARLNLQLSEFYGPLLSLVEANTLTYQSFIEKYSGPDEKNPFHREVPPSEQELAEWRTWSITVFIPNVQAMRDVVITKADLLIEDEMPSAMLQLCAHVSNYEILAARWAEGNYEEHLPAIRYPAWDLKEYARDRFILLKKRQANLLGRAGGSLSRRRETHRQG